jgi:hypothetical protein
MVIKKRRAASAEVSRQKKLGGHENEKEYAELINGERIEGTKKGDVEDSFGNIYSVKGGKKWQIFLYNYDRILRSRSLNILTPCLDAFTSNVDLYFSDKELCLNYKQQYINNHGRDKAKILTNLEVQKQIGSNTYIQSKESLAKATLSTCEKLKSKRVLKNFLREAIFNGYEVDFWAIKDETFRKDSRYWIFEREQVLDILTKELRPSVSKAGKTPEDYNVAGQKTLLCYEKQAGVEKNIVELEIRNDSKEKYRLVRFNMYSKDTLSILDRNINFKESKKLNSRVISQVRF